MTNRIYLECSYKDKNKCKKLGAKWDKAKKSWYVPEGLDPEPFKKWWSGKSNGESGYAFETYRNEERLQQLETTIGELIDSVNRLWEDPEDFMYKTPEPAFEEFQTDVQIWKEIKDENPETWGLYKEGVDVELLAFFYLGDEAKKRLLN